MICHQSSLLLECIWLFGMKPMFQWIRLACTKTTNDYCQDKLNFHLQTKFSANRFCLCSSVIKKYELEVNNFHPQLWWIVHSVPEDILGIWFDEFKMSTILLSRHSPILRCYCIYCLHKFWCHYYWMTNMRILIHYSSKL